MQKYDEEKVAQLKEIMQTRHLGYARTLRSIACKDLYAWINATMAQFSELDLNAKIYWLTHEIHEWPKCQHCKTKDIMHTAKCNARRGYGMHFCSKTYAQNANSRKAKYNATIAKRTDEMRAEIYKKRVATCLKTYGVENVSQSNKIAQKKSETMMSKTKEELYERALKTRATKFLRHGDENWQNVEKMKQTISRRTDQQRKQILKKRNDTFHKKYGVDKISNLC